MYKNIVKCVMLILTGMALIFCNYFNFINPAIENINGFYLIKNHQIMLMSTEPLPFCVILSFINLVVGILAIIIGIISIFVSSSYKSNYCKRFGNFCYLFFVAYGITGIVTANEFHLSTSAWMVIVIGTALLFLRAFVEKVFTNGR